jgi:hypothetical protein
MVAPLFLDLTALHKARGIAGGQDVQGWRLLGVVAVKKTGSASHRTLVHRAILESWRSEGGTWANCAEHCRHTVLRTLEYRVF